MNYYEMLLARKLAKGELPPNAYLLKTASGSLVSFSGGTDLPMPSFICNITANQDLHGYDAPWVGGAGKNKLPLTLDNIKALNTAGTWDGNTYTHPSGVTFTFTANNDGSITSIKADGTSPSSNVTLYLQQNITNSTYPNEMILSGCTSGGGSSTYKVRCQMQPSPNTTIADDFGEGANFTIPNDGNNYQVIIRIQSGVTVSNLMFYPMVRLATVTDSTFVPYSNICPISGHTGLDAWVRGKNLFGGWAKNQPYSESLYSQKIPVNFKGSTYYTFSGLGNTYNNIIYAYNSDNQLVGRLLGAKRDNVTVNKSMFNGGNEGTQDFDSISYLAVRFYSLTDEESKNTIKNYQIQAETGDTATTYEPYNPNSQTISVSWQTEAGEVFGGYIDLASGVLTVTHKSQTGFTRGRQDSTNKLYSIGFPADMKRHLDGTISPYFIDNMFEKMSLANARASETPSITQYNNVLYVGGYIGKEAELDTLLETLQVKYELETPLTYQLTPQQIKSLLGNNNAWCSTGDVTLEYFGKGAE